MEWAMSRGLAVEGHRVTKFPTSKMHGYLVPNPLFNVSPISATLQPVRC